MKKSKKYLSIVTLNLILALLFVSGCAEQKKDEKQDIKTENLESSPHAFIMENGLVFIADVPTEWRYTFLPIYEHTYYRNLFETGLEDEETDCRIQFIGMGEEDGEDNFFVITVREGEGLGLDGFCSEYSVTTEPFIFRDGTKGEWRYQTWEDYLHYAMMDTKKVYYEALVQDLGKKYNVHLLMLKDEYDANEEDITNFLKSACFRTNDLGVSGGTDFRERELLTLHIRNRYMNFSVQLPEGIMFEKEEFINEANCEACSYMVYLDEEKKNVICFYADQGGGMKDRTGDYRYYLDTEDFDELVYKIPEKRGYYFPNHNLMMWTWVNQGDEEMQKYVKQIAQSIQFE